jgi:hypothetical protein
LACSTLATFTAPALYTMIGITGIAYISATCTAISLLLFMTRVRDFTVSEAQP